MRRRTILGALAALPLLVPPRPLRAAQPRRISFRHAATGARFDGLWHTGDAPDDVAMREMSAALADPGCEPPLPFDPDTIGIVWEIAARTRMGGELDIHSGYRNPRVNRRVHGAGDSQHLRAGAVDLGVPSGRMPAVAEAALKLGKGGVGVYRQRGFIHLDSGPVRNWSDAGGTGRGGRNFEDDRIARIAQAWQLGGR